MRTNTRPYRGSNRIFVELIKIYCCCQKKNDNASKRARSHTHTVCQFLLCAIFFFLLIIRNIYTFLLLPPISNTYTLVHFFFVKTVEHRTVNKRTSSFSFIQLVDENGWKNVFSAVCKCSKVSYSQFSRVYAV